MQLVGDNNKIQHHQNENKVDWTNKLSKYIDLNEAPQRQTCPLRSISDFLSFFIAYTLPVVFSLQSLTCSDHICTISEINNSWMKNCTCNHNNITIWSSLARGNDKRTGRTEFKKLQNNNNMKISSKQLSID